MVGLEVGRGKKNIMVEAKIIVLAVVEAAAHCVVRAHVNGWRSLSTL